MIDYILGGISLVGFVFFLVLFGTSLYKDNQVSIPKRIVLAYIVFSFLNCIVLIPIQVLNLPWLSAFLYMIIVLISCILYSVYNLKKYNIKIIDKSVLDFSKRYYFLVVITGLLFVIYLFQYDLIWINNHLDDGYYLVKIATLPFTENPFRTDFATGLPAADGFNPYLLSSYELEASVFLYLLRIDPVIFCRVFLNIFNYFLFVCTIYCVGESIVEATHVKISKNFIQYFSIISILFSFEYTFLQSTGLFVVQDSWQYSSAMWYGSSIVRTMGIFWIIIPFLNLQKMTMKVILKVAGIGLVLLSRSAIAVPIVIVSCISYLLSFLLTTNCKKGKLPFICVFSILLIIGIVLPNKQDVNKLIINGFLQNKSSIILWLVFFTLTLGWIKYRNTKLKRLFLVMFFIFCLIVVPQLNDFFELYSIYWFPALRAQTCYIYSVTVTSFVLFSLFLYDLLIKRMFKVVYSFLFFALLSGSIFSISIVYGSPIRVLKTMYNNWHIMPNCTVQISKSLGKSGIENMNVISPEWVDNNGNRHAMAVMLRTYAPNIHSLSTIGRYSVSEKSKYATFFPEGQEKYNNFLSNPGNDSFLDMMLIINKYDVEGIIFNSDIFENYKSEAGFTLYDEVENYYVYIKTSILKK